MSIDVEPLKQFLGKHKGQPCVLLANGTSLNDADFEQIPEHVVTIGLNASWTNYWADYHVVADRKQAEVAPNIWNRLKSQDRLPVGCKGPDVFRHLGHEGRLFVYGVWPSEYKGYYMPRMCKSTRPGNQTALSFSTNIAEGVQMGLAGFGAVSYLGLQVAVTLGCNPIYWLGLDLGYDGKHHHGWHDADRERMARQAILFQHAETIMQPLGFKTYNVNSPNSACDVYPKISWKTFIDMTT